MEHEQLRNHIDSIGKNLHSICKEIAEILIILHVPKTLVTDTPLPVTNETPVPALATEEKGRISSRQIALLRKVVNEKMAGDWIAFDASCKQRFGKSVNYLNTKEASVLISELIGGSNGNRAYSPNR